jgi:AcrR family transcriptional regulator
MGASSKSERHGKLQSPFADPVSSLPGTAQKILAAAIRLLSDGGYTAVTLENVAAEAGVNKASIRYNFGNKNGLMLAVADALIHDECLRIAADVEEVPEGEQLHAAIEGIRGMIVEAHSFQGWFDILPYAFRDPELRTRMSALYPWWYEQNLKWLGLYRAGFEQDEILIGLAELMAAIPDGLSAQAALDPENFDLARPLAVLELLLRNSMDELKRAAAAATPGEAGSP